VRDFVKVTGAVYAEFLGKPDAWSVSSPQAEKIARLTGAKLEDVPQLLKGYVFPTLEEQASDKFLGGGTVKAVEATSAFLKEQGKIDAVLPDYSKYVTAKYATEALASN
jgi:taurine transport system substrate-binding protein